MSISITNAQAATIAEFKTINGAFFTDNSFGFIAGNSTELDGGGGIYVFDTSSTATDDGFLILKPDNISSGNPGRWLRYLRFDTPADSFIPTGSILMWGTDTAPTGWSLCDGSAISRTTYAALFAVIATNYGLGDGSTTFNVPDMRQRFPLGKSSSGTGNTLGNTGGSIDHLHTVDPPSTTTSVPSATVTGLALLGIAGAASDTHTHSVDIASFNSGTANPPYVVVNYIIKQ